MKIKVEAIKLSKSLSDTLEACRYCFMCRQACPSEFISYRESDTPRGRGIILQSVYKTGQEYTKSKIEAVYNCFVCGSCTSWCEGAEIGHYDIPELIKFARRDIVKQKLMSPAVEMMCRSLVENENCFGQNKSESFSSKIKETEADVLYLAGGEVNFRNNEIAEAMLKIFRYLNVKVTMLKDEPSCGKILDLLGYQEEAILKASQLAKRIRSTGCKTIVVSDPLILHCLRNDIPGWAIDLNKNLKILHSSEYLAELIKSGLLKLNPVKEKVTLADSEFLGRYNNIYDAPREVIGSSAGSNFAELKWNRDKLLCTGESAFIHDDKVFSFGKKLGEEIAILANDIGAGTIVTLSAAAKNNLEGFKGFKALEISEFVAGLI